MRKKNIVYALYLFTVTVIALEIILRIYNPFHFRIKGDKIILNTNKQYTIYNKSIPVIEDTILHTVNSLGFRGPEKIKDDSSQLSVITVGGSTTACTYLSDSLTWSNKLYNKLNTRFDVWLNNAGLAGHSTFGHLVLMKDYILKLKPQVVIYLIGCNDIERSDLNASDNSYMADKYANVFTFLSKKSELCNTIINLVRSRKATVNHLDDTYIDVKARKQDTLTISGQDMDKLLKTQTSYLESYKDRVTQLIQICISNQIKPVLITQPALFGQGIDSLSGVDLGEFKLWEGMNGLLWWKRMELYNEVVRQIAREQGVLLIDLAREMPKNSAYFYDIVHFTRDGTSKVSDLVYAQLLPWLEKNYAGYLLTR